MAPSPTGLLHIGGVRTFLFNWLFARGHSGECLLRIENTDTSREVSESVEQIERSLRWLGIEWDGETTFQLDVMERAKAEASRLVSEGKAYEDDGAIRIHMPDEGATSWDDAIKGRIEVLNAELEDLVLVRLDGRPTYNFASPLEDWLDGITHVIRGDDHVSNTPKQVNVLRALGAEPPVYAHVPNVFGADGKKLSKRHGAVSVEAALDRLLDPEDGIGRKLVTAAPVELLRSADQAEHRFLDQVAHRQAVALVAAGELDHQAQVRVDQLLLGGEVTGLDPLRELDLLGAGEQGVLGRLVEEELEAVGGVLGELVSGIAAPARARGGVLGGVLAANSVCLGVGALAFSAMRTGHTVPSGISHLLQKV